MDIVDNSDETNERLRISYFQRVLPSPAIFCLTEQIESGYSECK